MHDVLLPAADRLAAHVDEPGVAQPLRQPLDPVELQHAAPQIAVEPARARPQTAHRDDDRPADERPHPPAAGGVAHRVVVHRQRRPGLEEVVELPQRDVRRGQVPEQVRGEDPVELARHAGRGEVHGVAVHEGDRVRPLLGARGVQHLHRRVDGDDLGLRRDLQQGRRGGAGAAPEVEQAKASPVLRQPHPLGGEPQVVVVAGIGADQTVVARGVVVECAGHGTGVDPAGPRGGHDPGSSLIPAASARRRRRRSCRCLRTAAAASPVSSAPSPAWPAARGPSRRCAAGTARRSGRPPSGSPR